MQAQAVGTILLTGCYQHNKPFFGFKVIGELNQVEGNQNKAEANTDYLLQTLLCKTKTRKSDTTHKRHSRDLVNYEVSLLLQRNFTL
jgi:hypothetical protein